MKKINVDPKDLEPIETDGINLLYIGTFLFALATFGIIYQPNWIDDDDTEVEDLDLASDVIDESELDEADEEN